MVARGRQLGKVAITSGTMLILIVVYAYYSAGAAVGLCSWLPFCTRWAFHCSNASVALNVARQLHSICRSVDPSREMPQ